MAISLFRFIAAVGRKDVLANTAGGISLLLVFILGGFIVARGKLLDVISEPLGLEIIKLRELKSKPTRQNILSGQTSFKQNAIHET